MEGSSLENHDLWKEVRQQINAHETRYEELQELLRSSKAALNAAEDQYKSSEDERATLNKQFADIQTQKNALVDEKQRLTHQAGKLEEEGNILHQQLVLLKQTKNFLELKVEQDRKNLEMEAASQKERLDSYKQLISSLED